METVLEADDFFLLLETLLAERRAAIRGQGRIAFTVVGAGSWVLDLAKPTPLARGFDESAETIVLCNRRGLAELLSDGRERTSEVEPGAAPVLLWSGEPAPLASLSRALGGNRSLFDTRLSELRGAR